MLGEHLFYVATLEDIANHSRPVLLIESRACLGPSE